MIVLIIGQCQQILGSLDDNAAAVAAIAAVRATFRDKLLASETDTSVSAVAGFYMNPHQINEFHCVTRFRFTDTRVRL